MNRERATVLYKYKDISGDGIKHVEDMLRNNRIWFSSPLDFNDPFDCCCVYDIQNTREEIVLRKAEFLAKKGAFRSDALSRAEADIPQHPSEVEKWQEQQAAVLSRRAANTGILCLTSICDNPIMWTHYANKHTGICIVFRVRDVDEEQHLDFIAEAQRIVYVDRCPVTNVIRDEGMEIVRKAFFTKAAPYSYETEWRIARYDDGPGLKPMPRGIIGRVILGVKIESAARNRIIKACADYDGRVEIVQARLDPQTYGLRLELERTV
jgi:hypothetical protein